VRQGRSPVVEEKIGELTAEVVTAGMLTVTTDAYATVLGTDISLICVGTPSTAGGGLSTRFLEQVTTERRSCPRQVRRSRPARGCRR
jgi:GDP-mannose 6-dehydrogenase